MIIIVDSGWNVHLYWHSIHFHSATNKCEKCSLTMFFLVKEHYIKTRQFHDASYCSLLLCTFMDIYEGCSLLQGKIWLSHWIHYINWPYGKISETECLEETLKMGGLFPKYPHNTLDNELNSYL